MTVEGELLIRWRSSRKRKRRSSAEDSDEDWNPESSSEESDEDGELPDSDVDDFGDWSGEQEVGMPSLLPSR